MILRWLRQSNIIAIPKSVHEERIEQNFDIDDFNIISQDMQWVESIDLEKSLILVIVSLEEVYRLYNIRFEQ
ncbi:hypothetical protein ACSVC9_08435 [Clostridium sp. LBM24168]